MYDWGRFMKINGVFLATKDLEKQSSSVSIARKG